LLQDWFSNDLYSCPQPFPQFHPEAAVWGSIVFFRAICFHHFREIVDAEVHSGMRLPMPDESNPAAHVSADLTLRHLPFLFDQARQVNTDDSLTFHLQQLADQLPLSGVSIERQLDPESPPLTDSTFKQMVVERAVEHNCRYTLSHDVLSQFAREKLGSYAKEFCLHKTDQTDSQNEP
ncbi:MAG: hypothetical protein AAF226_03935, partial [Verrucomicrobiota bacterium]